MRNVEVLRIHRTDTLKLISAKREWNSTKPTRRLKNSYNHSYEITIQ